ncbi:endonuclease/exonuclease/phosphatase family protein [Planktotalea sp.]|uniref:endonuclease/exonuclease/phosphatase family protein n=1 Tax=Planktotalea sp. TaxID=2029877 RepID=UPI0035C7DA09
MLASLTKIILALFALTALVACAQQLRNSGQSELAPKPQGALRVATQNVHYIWLGKADGAWSVSDWERRKDAMDAAFKTIDADLFAFQEMESFDFGSDPNINLARDWLTAQNPDYALAAHGPADVFPPTQPIFYRKERLNMVDQGWFFFSDTPDVIYSRTFNGSYPAFASWALMEDRQSGSRFYAINLHFEFKSASNRQLSAALVADRIAPSIKAGTPVVMLGDLNARKGAKTFKILESAGITFAPIAGSTYHLNRGANLFGAIDHIGVANGPAPVRPPVVLRKSFDGVWPSDHYPVALDLRLP